ncbi:MAG: hypothetical protein ACRDUA_05020 [Micromonosporaceae bacterium]
MTTRNDHQQTRLDDELTGEVVSRHVTSEGILTYFRSSDGQLGARLHRWNGDDGTGVGYSQPEARCA